MLAGLVIGLTSRVVIRRRRPSYYRVYTNPNQEWARGRQHYFDVIPVGLALVTPRPPKPKPFQTRFWSLVIQTLFIGTSHKSGEELLYSATNDNPTPIPSSSAALASDKVARAVVV